MPIEKSRLIQGQCTIMPDSLTEPRTLYAHVGGQEIEAQSRFGDVLDVSTIGAVVKS